MLDGKRSASRDVQDCLCLHLRRSARQITQFYDERLRESGLKTTQFQLMAAISEMVSQAGPSAHQPLAEMMGMDRTTLTRNLALLEREGLVRVEKAKRDRRERAIQLTAAGQQRLNDAMPLWQEAQAMMKGKLAAESKFPEFAGLLSMLRQVGNAGER